MQAGRSSRTAEYAASFRAVESLRRPARVRLFEDPFAIQFISPDLQRLVRITGLPLLGALLRAYVDRRWPGAMTSGIARTRLIDEWLLASVRDGIRQVVLLGAGFDCRAHRLPELAPCRVFEIDHPDTQARKRATLARLVKVQPPNIVYAPADLTRDDLRQVLQLTDLDWRDRIFLLWEGVTHYIGAAAVDTTLRTVRAFAAPGSRIVFTYLHGGLIDGTTEFDGARFSQNQVAGDGEPWIFGIYPNQLSAFLAERGYRLLEDCGANEYRARYWGKRGQRMRGFAFYRAALAEVQL